VLVRDKCQFIDKTYKRIEIRIQRNVTRRNNNIKTLNADSKSTSMYKSDASRNDVTIDKNSRKLLFDK